MVDSDIYDYVNHLTDLESTNCSEICDIFFQLPFYDLNDFIGEDISQNDDIALQEEANSDLKPFIHIFFEEKIPLKESRSENILQREEFHALISSSYFSMYYDLFDNNGI